MTLPKPEPGLVIRYSYLWFREYQEGREEGVKDRPCAIILATKTGDSGEKVIVLPVTHSAPAKDIEALELPAPVKKRLGLDSERSWVVISENNQFTWPGPDLRRTGGRDDSSVAYGFLPPKFFAELQRRWLALYGSHAVRNVGRTE